MGGLQELIEVGFAGWKDAVAIAVVGEGPRHVEGSPGGDSVTEMFGEDASIVGVVGGKIAIGPAAAVFKRLRQIPVIDGAEGADVGFEEDIDEAAVVVDSLLIDLACAGGLNARPGCGEAIAFEVEALEDCDVFFVVMILVARRRRRWRHL